MQSESGDKKPTQETKEQKIETIPTVPVLFDIEPPEINVLYKDQIPGRFFSFTLVRGNSRTDEAMWFAKSGIAGTNTFYWPLQNQRSSTSKPSFLADDLLGNLVAMNNIPSYINTPTGRCGIVVADNKLLVIQGLKMPDETVERLCVSIKKSIFKTEETNDFFNKLAKKTTAESAAYLAELKRTGAKQKRQPWETLDDKYEGGKHTTIFPKQIKVFPNQRHVALNYEGERIFIVDTQSDIVFYFNLPDEQRIEAFAINQDNTITVFPSPIEGQAPPDYYFHMTFDFTKATTQIEKRPSNLIYQPIANASCIGPNALLLITEEKEHKEEKEGKEGKRESKEAEQKEPAPSHYSLKRVIIDPMAKSAIKLAEVIDKTHSPNQIIVSDSGDFVVYQSLDRQIHVFDCLNKQDHPCPFDGEVKSMTLGSPRVIYMMAQISKGAPKTMHYCSVPIFTSPIDLKEQLATSLPRLSHDIIGVILGFIPSSKDDGSPEMTVPLLTGLEISGASLMGTSIQSFQRVDYWRTRVNAIQSIDDLKQVMDDALLQLNIILRLTRVEKYENITTLGDLYSLLLYLKEYIEDPKISSRRELALLEQGSTIDEFGENHIPTLLMPWPVHNCYGQFIPTIALWNALIEKTKTLPEISAREYNSDIAMSVGKIKRFDEYKKPAHVDTAESIANALFKEINPKAEPGIVLSTLIEWIKAVEAYLALYAKSKLPVLSSLSALFHPSPPRPEVVLLSLIRRQMGDLLPEAIQNKITVLNTAAQLLLDFSKRKDCPEKLKSPMQGLAHDIMPIEKSKYEARTEEEKTTLASFNKVLEAIASKDKKTMPILKAVSTWLEAGIAQIGVIKFSSGGLFEEKAESADLRKFKQLLEKGFQITIEESHKKRDPNEIDLQLTADINVILSDLAKHPACPATFKKQIEDITRNLMKFFPGVPKLQ